MPLCRDSTISNAERMTVNTTSDNIVDGCPGDDELVACPGGVMDSYALAARMSHSGRMARWAASQVPAPSRPSTGCTSMAKASPAACGRAPPSIRRYSSRSERIAVPLCLVFYSHREARRPRDGSWVVWMVDLGPDLTAARRWRVP